MDLKKSTNRKIIFISLLILCVYTLRLSSAMPPSAVPADRLIGEKVIFTGVIVGEPDERDDSIRYTVRPEGEMKEFKILITAERFPKLDYGDKIEVAGELEFPKKFETDFGRTFNYQNYLAKDGVRYVSYRPQISLLDKNQGSKFLSALFSFKKKFMKNIEETLPEPHSSLAGGVTLGLKQSLGEELLETFREAGVIHIVVLSGYNMTIILTGAFYVFGRLKRNLALLAGALLTIAFVALVGFSATVLRASIMALLAILARFLGRPVFALRALFVAGISMLLWNPLTLIYDPSFQLSFLATFGLIVLSPAVEEKLKLVPKLSKIFEGDSKIKIILREIIIATIATQIFVLPALVYMTGQISVVSLAANILILPLVPWAMASSALVGASGFISIFIAKILALPAYWLLEAMIKISEILAGLPLAVVSIKFFPFWLVVLWYSSYMFFLYRKGKSKAVSSI